ncbi:YdaS family helix-turn-helix protein [Aquitalea sp. LB_tupeE]|uniref:transcriptional regulator n=1 Tax=Aquitalea sp. LB_tupeE TaxID=2748078 RepID=UPI0015BF4EE2|nr:YdaS family helix-turn-helix protein [Aquitalea sp. LB_tupeE]NWK79765.1 helix-turn-helix domain-containing protein [Aquitalea sp. LB_tupeE]
MNLRTFLNSMKPAEQAEFARRCDTSIAYLRKAISSRQPLRVALCVDIERESGRLVTRQELRADWARLWPELISANADASLA